MLLDLPIKRLNFIKDLRRNYKTFLFSNTNEIHLKEVFNICKRQNGFNTFEGCFEQEYYSHILGKRKPHYEAFISILNEHNIIANETLFIDDSFQHVLGARAAGLYTIHLVPEKSIFDVLSFINEINTTKLKEETDHLTDGLNKRSVLFSKL